MTPGPPLLLCLQICPPQITAPPPQTKQAQANYAPCPNVANCLDAAKPWALSHVKLLR